MAQVGSLIRDIEANAVELVKKAGSVPILVLSDRYPPDNAGGAEISLHLILRRLIGAIRFVVVTFAATVDDVGWATIDRVDVLRLPRSAAWPLQAWPSSVVAAAEAKPLAARASTMALGLAAGILSPQAGSADRLRGLATWLAGPSRDLTMEHVSHPAAWHLQILKRAVEILQPRLIHADNLYSILAATEIAAGSGVRLVGQIRDNRFLCARKDQDTRIDGVPCVACAVGCVAADTLARRRIVRTMMRTRDYRRTQLRRLDRIIVASDYLERQIRLIAPDTLVVRIENPVDDPEQIAAWITSAPEPIGNRVAVVGTLREGKGQAALLRKLPELRRAIPDIELHLAGRGPDEAALKGLATELGQADRVTFHGHLPRPQLYRLLGSCRVVAVPSLWPEPFGRVPLEAALAERPVVVFKVGGLPETVDDQKTGLLVEGGDFDAFAAAIVRLLRNPDVCIKFAAAAKKKMLADRDSANLAAQVLAVWEEELGLTENQ